MVLYRKNQIISWKNKIFLLKKLEKFMKNSLFLQIFYIFQQTPLIFAKAHYFNLKLDLRSGFFSNIITFLMLFLSFK